MRRDLETKKHSKQNEYVAANILFIQNCDGTTSGVFHLYSDILAINTQGDSFSATMEVTSPERMLFGVTEFVDRR